MDKLGLSRFTYELKAKSLMRNAPSLSEEELAMEIETLAKWMDPGFCGLLNDVRLDQLIRDRWFTSKREAKPARIERVVHIATEVYPTGGHTKIINQWLKLDPHSVGLILTGDESCTISFPEGKRIACLGGKGHLEVADHIRRLCNEWQADMVVLHHHSFDVTPFIALGKMGHLHSAVFEHTDHKFWLGGSLTGLCVSFRQCAADYCLAFRQVRNSVVLPFAFFAQHIDIPKPAGPIRLVAMASAYKFKPRGSYNFMSTFARYLRERPEIHLQVIGVTKEQFEEYTDEALPANMEMLGLIPNPQHVLDQAHYFVESFPIYSLLSSMDCAGRGAVPILAYGKVYDIYGESFSTVMPSLDMGSSDWNEEEYIRFLDEEFATGAYRTQALKKIETHAEEHSIDKWPAKVKAIYTLLESKKPAPVPLEFDLEEVRKGFERWHEFSAYDCYADFKHTVLKMDYMSLSDLMKSIRMALKLRKAGHIDFPNNDIKKLLKAHLL